MRCLNSLLGWIALAALCGTGCSAPARTPQETVGLYLKGLKGRDPMRTLQVLTADFHRHHGMIFANTARLPDGIELDQSMEGDTDDPEWAAERGRLGWLVAPSQSEAAYTMFPRLKHIQLGWQENQERGDRAAVKLRAWVEGETSVTFVFQLQRLSPTQPWKINSVAAQSDGTLNAYFIQYVISPNFEIMEFIRREAASRFGEPP